jgi:acyl-homoserine-lactone acylase
VYSLNGTRSECYWNGRLPSRDLPWVIRTDYVANSNNNYELPNVDARLVGKSPILGVANQPLALRPALGLKMIEDRLSGVDGLGKPGFSATNLKQLFVDKRHYGAELLVDGIVELCASDAALKPVCDALKGWDRKMQKESRGAHVFVGMWIALREKRLTDALFAVPASLDDPLHTPSGLTPDPAVRAEVLGALARVAAALAAAGVAPDARWEDVHFVTGKGGKRFGLPGGPGTQGIFDSLHSLNVLGFDAWTLSLKGFVPAELYGSSYTHIVEFGPEGPNARAIVAHSQATEPGSPWFLDQLRLLSNGSLFKLPFTSAEIKADLKSERRF